MTASPPWLEELRERPERAGNTAAIRGASVARVSDHFRDILEEIKDMDAESVETTYARMGEPGDLTTPAGISATIPRFYDRVQAMHWKSIP
jgi:hypothetical protein